MALMRLKRATAVLMMAISGLLAGCGGGGEEVSGDVTIFTGPRFWTGDETSSWAEALLVSEGRVVRAVARAEMPRLIADGGTVITLPGELAVPGLVDAHGHIAGYGFTLQQVNLVGTRTLDETLERIADFAAAHPDLAWLQGRGWDQNDWPTPVWPDADRLEQVIPGRPAALRRVDGHAMWVNRSALAEAGIDSTTEDPPGGSIHRDTSGRPTGMLIDSAMDLVRDVIPEPTEAEIEAALEAAAEDLVRVGLTGVHDMGIGVETWEAMKRLAAEGRFPLSVHAYASLDSPLYETLRKTGPQHVGRLHLAGVKLYADGALGSRGARLLEPYSDESTSRGLWLTEPGPLAEDIQRAVSSGLQPATHAIGDAANRAVLDACAALETAPEPATRPRIEHAQIIHPDDLPRVAALGVVASMQPTHATSDMPWAEQRLGEDRLAGSYAWKTLLDSGAILALGSDFPVEAIDPRYGIYSAVTRQDHAGQPAGGWRPHERLEIAEAVRGFSLGAARAVAAEESEGSLAPGRFADMTVFDRNILEKPPSELLEARVTATVIGGELFLPQDD